MASPLNRTGAAAVGTAPVTVLTVPALKVWTLIDVSCCNLLTSQVKGTIRTVASGVTTNFIVNGPVPAGSAMVVIGAPRKVVLRAADTLVAVCDTLVGMDVTVSYIEQDA